MPAIAFDGSSLTIRSREREPPRPPGEARIRLRLGGICRTDLEITRGYLGFRGVLGHEFVGEVLEADQPALHGRRVVGGINCACTRCDFCNRGLPNHCPERTVLGIQRRDGAFQDTFLLPERNLVRVPDGVPDDVAVFAEPLAAACRILEQVDPAPWDRAAVLGDGKLGLLAALVLARRVHSVVLIGRHPGRVPLPAAIQEQDLAQVGRERFPLVVEATGRAEGLAEALRLTAPLGKLVLKSTVAGDHSLALAPLVVDEITVIGSRCGNLETALDLMRSGELPLDRLVAARYPLAAAPAAFARAAAPGALKVLLEGAAQA